MNGFGYSMIKLLFSILASALLASCASGPQVTPPADSWRLQGRIGYWAEGVKESGNIDWQYCGPESGTLKLQGPLGIGGFVISSEPGGATLDWGDQHYRASSTEELAYRAGWPIPVSALQYWVRGRAAPDSPLKGQLDTRGRLLELEQYDWKIHYQAYHHKSDAESWPVSALPARIEASQGDQRIKLIIQNWLPANCHD